MRDGMLNSRSSSDFNSSDLLAIFLVTIYLNE